MTCSICCDPFTYSTRAEITCPRQECEFTCCKSCMKTYFTTSINNPHCMNCKYEFEDMFIIENINYTFFKSELKKKQMELLLQIEQSRIPQSQEEAKRILYNKNRMKIKIDIEKQQKELQTIYLLNIERLKKNYLDECLKLDKLIPPSFDKKISPHKTSTVKCQKNDCKGFLSTSYKCGLCDSYTCSKCYEVKENKHEHMCDKEKVETVQLIKKETRSCPVCTTRISKINGCDQMWCTHCNNAFSWKTGQVQTGRIHNPHYFDFLKKQNGYQPRNPLDVLCGGIPNLSILLGYTSKLRPNVDAVESNINFIHQFCSHLQGTRTPFPMDNRLEGLRVSYILNILPLDKWKKGIYNIHSTEKHHKFEWDMDDIIINVGCDLLRNYEKFASETNHSVDELTDYVINNTVKEFAQIIDYVNELKLKKAKAYKRKARVIICEQIQPFINNYSKKYVDPS